MLLLHMQIRRYFNKICDKSTYLISHSERISTYVIVYFYNHFMLSLFSLSTSYTRTYSCINTNVQTKKLSETK